MKNNDNNNDNYDNNRYSYFCQKHVAENLLDNLLLLTY